MERYIKVTNSKKGCLHVPDVEEPLKINNVKY